MKKSLLIALACLLIPLALNAQIIEAFQPLYYTTGIPLSGPVDKSTADVKFQFSLAIPVAHNMGGHEGLNLKFGYTQISIWDFYDESSPFKDNLFIPGIYLDIPLSKNSLCVGLEHRSNGRPYRGTAGDVFSRSTNALFGEYTAFLPHGFALKANLRWGIGWYDEELTQEIFYRFQGYATFSACWKNEHWAAQLSATPLFAPFDANISAELSYKLGRASIFGQYHYGYDEAFCDCIRGVKPLPYIRIGVLFGELF
ncbi:MAG: phospholipase A [Bacteroidales bacterium]|nr:phospholipase A [Bacteroidales bacterium]